MRRHLVADGLFLGSGAGSMVLPAVISYVHRPDDCHADFVDLGRGYIYQKLR